MTTGFLVGVLEMFLKKIVVMVVQHWVNVLTTNKLYTLKRLNRWILYELYLKK